MSMGGGDASRLNGIPTVEPVFGIQAMWVPEDEKRNAEVEGCTVVDLIRFGDPSFRRSQENGLLDSRA